MIVGDDEHDDEWRPDFGWGPLAFRGTCVAVVLGSLGVLVGVVLVSIALATGTFVPGPGQYDWGPQARPNYGVWTFLVLPGAAIFALIFMFYSLVEILRRREIEPFTRAYTFEFSTERKHRGLIHTLLLGVLTAVIRRR